MVERAPAKLNLFLHVLGRRSDGYHDLDSLVAFASIADVVTLVPSERAELRVDGPFADDMPADAESNLVLRAARALARATGRAPDVSIHLTKTLPVAAGIGGGSADAAATLRALGRLWRLSSAEQQMLPGIAARLGADVPVCLSGATSRVGGIGDRIRRSVDISGIPVLLCNPGVPLATPAVFAALDGKLPERDDERDDPPTDFGGLIGWLSARRNDLEPAACR